MARESKLLRTTMLLTFIIILSKIAGFAREMIMAGYFGLSVESDAYGVSYSILSIFTILFGAAIGSTFIPIYTKAEVERGELYANVYASNVFNLYVITAILTSIVAYIFAPTLTQIMWRNPEGGDIVTRLTRIMLPSLVCWSISGVLVNLLDARKHFVPEQLIGFALSFCVIFACLVYGTIEAVATATSVTALMQVGILAPFLRGQFKWRPVLNLKSKRLRTTFLLALPALISVAFDEINHAADKIFGSEIGIGVVSSLTKSYTLVQTAISVLVIPITTVMFTQLSQYAARNQMDELKRTVRESIEIIAFITLPIIVICFTLSTDVIGVFYQRGSFTYENTLFTAPAFAFYIAGIFGFGLRNFLTRVFYSIQQTRVPMFLGVISVSLNILLDFLWKDSVVLNRIVVPNAEVSVGAAGLTFATTVASLTGAILMLIVLRTKVGSLKMRSSVIEFLKMIGATVAAGAAIWVITGFLPDGTGFKAQFLRLTCGIVAGAVVYVGAAYLMRIREARRVLGMFRSRFARLLHRRDAARKPAEHKPVLPKDLLEEAPIEAMEDADLNYPGPQFMPQPPAYRTMRILDTMGPEETPYSRENLQRKPLSPTRRRIGMEDLSAKTVAFRIPDSIRVQDGAYGPPSSPEAYHGHAKYRKREELEAEVYKEYERKKQTESHTRRKIGDDTAGYGPQ